MTARILIVEDEPALVRGLKDAFAERGFDVMTALDGATATQMALEKSPDIMLLDIMIPRVNGFEVCRTVREHGLEIPILMLTAKGQEEDIVLGLNLGADDYIGKPFRLAELIARVHAFLRRSKARQSEVFRFGDFELNRSAHKLYRKGVEVELTPREFKLLEYMAGRRGCALTRNDILNAVWGYAITVTPRSIDRCVATLRAKIEEPGRTSFIETIRDIGYRFEPGAER